MSNTLDLNDNDGLRAAAEALRSSGWLRFATIVEQHIAEVERLRAEVGMLQQEARIRKNICDGLASEAAAERAAVLRWLRRVDANVYPSWVALADDIERGEHRRKEER